MVHEKARWAVLFAAGTIAVACGESERPAGGAHASGSAGRVPAGNGGEARGGSHGNGASAGMVSSGGRAEGASGRADSGESGTRTSTGGETERGDAGATSPNGGAAPSDGSAGCTNDECTTGQSGNAASSGAAGEHSAEGGIGGTAGELGESGANGDAPWPPPIDGAPETGLWRFWDCCKPSCGSSQVISSGNPVVSCDLHDESLGTDYSAKNACDNPGVAYMCHDFAPWAVSDELSFGFIAFRENANCGECYELAFTGGSDDIGGAPEIAGKMMVVQVVEAGGIGSSVPYLLVPGGGVDGFATACETQWGTSLIGAPFGGFLATCHADVACAKDMCETAFAGKQDLLAPCLWYFDWLRGADVPSVKYQPIACPKELTERSGRSGPSVAWPP